jgi:hydrogenase 3 maturation protease
MNFRDFSLDLIDFDPHKITFVAIGNKMRGDDGISFYFMEKLTNNPLFKESNFIDVGTNPENYLNKILNGNPELVIFIDAADFGGLPGEIRWLDNHQVNSIDISTHAFSIKLVEEFLSAENKILFKYVGIQPLSIKFEGTISKALLDSVNSFFNN